MMPTAADSCPNMAAPLWRETRSLASHSSSNTDTGTQAEGGNSLCVCVRDQSSSSVCACLSPWAGGEGREDRWRSGQRDLISSPLGGIQVFCRPNEEQRKLKHFCFCCGFKDHRRIKNQGTPFISIRQAVCSYV